MPTNETTAPAISTYNTKLMYKTSQSGTYSQLVAIKSHPSLGSNPEKIEITSYDDSMKTYIPGLQDPGDAFEFDANYTKAAYRAIKALVGQDLFLALYLGNNGDGADGIFEFKGQVDCYLDAGQTNAAHQMKVSVTPSTAITLAAD